MKINNFINVKTISMGPIVIEKGLIFERFEDVEHFLECLKKCEEVINTESEKTNRIYFTRVCKILHDCFIELGFMPRTLPKPSTDMDYFIEFIWDLDNINRNYKVFYCVGSSVINFEYDNPFYTPEGWLIKNLTIWFDDFTNEEVL